MGFSRQESWSGLLCLPSGDLPDLGIKPAFLVSPALTGGFFNISVTWKALFLGPQILLQVFFSQDTLLSRKGDT